jgi:hypothetical protein
MAAPAWNNAERVGALSRLGLRDEKEVGLGRFLDMIDTMERLAEPGDNPAVAGWGYDINAINDKSPTGSENFGRLNRLCRTSPCALTTAPPSAFTTALEALERRCPDHVEPDRWQQAVNDGRRFLAEWGTQVAVLGWRERDLFGLHEPPAKPHPTYCRLSRLDHTGLVWLLRGQRVVAITETSAVIEAGKGGRLVYRKALAEAPISAEPSPTP